MKIIKNFPAERQTHSWDCGASALQSILIYYGYDIREEEIIKLLKTNGRTGTSIKNIKKVAKKFNLKFKEGRLNIEKLKENVKNKIPTLIAIQAWNKRKIKSWKNEWNSGHYLIVIGYSKKYVYFEDPACITKTFLSWKELLERWHDIDIEKGKKIKLKNWGIYFYGKEPVYNPNKAIPLNFESYSIFKHFYKIIKNKYKRIK